MAARSASGRVEMPSANRPLTPAFNLFDPLKRFIPYQPFPEAGDLVASWMFRGKMYEPR